MSDVYKSQYDKSPHDDGNYRDERESTTSKLKEPRPSKKAPERIDPPLHTKTTEVLPE